jgi:hypothetical protein
MAKVRTGWWLCSATLISLALALAATEQRASGDDAPVKKVKRTHARLPPHYAGVVNDEQRQEIYRLQEEYKPKIKAMQAELNATKNELNEKIAAVLTADQKRKIDEATGKAKKASPPEVAPASPPAEAEQAE